MEMKEVVSSNIHSVGYENGILQIQYRGGGIYNYFDVPKTLFEHLMKAESKGRFVNANINKKFKYEKLVPLKPVTETAPTKESRDEHQVESDQQNKGR